MARRMECGWRVEAVGDMSVQVTEDATGTPSPFTVTISTGRYTHTNIAAAVTSYVKFGAALTTSLNAGSPTGASYTVTFDGATGRYTITNDQAPTKLTALTFSSLGDPGARMRQALGFSGDQAAAASHTSDVRPYYLLLDDDPVSPNGWDADSGDYDPGGRWEQVIAQDGSSYAQGPTGAVRYRDFAWQAMPRNRTFKAAATSAVPYTWQHFLEHAGAIEPVFAWDGIAPSGLVGYLRTDGADFSERTRSREVDASDLLWRWDVLLEVVGEASP